MPAGRLRTLQRSPQNHGRAGLTPALRFLMDRLQKFIER
jgi:hypothetical protein